MVSRLHRVKLGGGILAWVLLSSCNSPAVETGPGDASQPAWVGRMWTSTDTSAPRGDLRIFLPDGTLLMDSCFETYRLARWTLVDARRIAWQEDTARIEAEVLAPGPDQLILTVRLGGENSVQNYRLAEVPFVCPDMPR
jgi:hypothetical protein